MISPSMIKINNLIRLSFILIVLHGVTCLHAKDDLPVPSAPSDWVNDYARVFNNNEKKLLSDKLNRFEYRSSTQVYIVTIREDNGYPISMLAPLIGEKWGVGQEGKENGLIILMNMNDREVFIAPGYGLEEYIPDAIAKRIVSNEIIPAFKKDDYFGGIDSATNVIISLLEGKFTPDEYRKKTSSPGEESAVGVFIIIMLIIIFNLRRRRYYGTGGRRSSLPFWIALGMLSGMGRSSSGFGNFSSGSGGFGGFTGGGGGSFGGGGAGGSW